MKTVKKHQWNRGHQRVPVLMHVAELVMGVLIVAGGQGLWSSIVRADADITPPSVPVNISLAGRSATGIDLTWDVSTDDAGVTGYHVYRNNVLVGTPVTNAFSDSNLTPNTAYTYTISAFDAAANESARSSSFGATTLIDTSAPSIPSNIHQTGSTTSTISLAWNASSDNVAVTGYEIYRNGSLIKTQAGTTFTDTGLAVFTSYTYTITAHDAANNTSSLSQPLFAATAKDVTPPSVPDNVRKTGSTITSISLAWDAASDDVGIAGYRVYRDGVLVGSPGGTTFTDTGLAVGSSYTYSVTARDAAGNQSAQSAPFSTSSSTDTTPPTTPTNLHTTAILDSSVSLAWTAPTDDVAVTGYKIYRDGALVGTSATVSYTDSGLSPATNYSYAVRAYDAASNTSAASASLNTQTAYDTTVPSVPTNLVASSKTDTSITLAWDSATDNIAVTGYDIYRDGVLISTTSGTNYTDSGLAVDTSYTYRIRAHDGSGNNSAQSSQLVTRTLTDTIAPSVPTALASPSQTTTSLDLTWNPASDDVAVVSYNLYRDGNLLTNVPSTAYSDSGLDYNHRYNYEVRAVDAANNESAASNTLAVNTLPDTTAPTVSLTAPTAAQNWQLTFPISATASDDLELDRVDFYADSTLIASLSSPPFSFNWNSYAVHNGSRLITARANDKSGNATSQAVTITIANPPPPLVGDLNGDHRVNILDLSILLSHWRKAGAGDFNNSGKVDIFDLSVLLGRYGQDNSNYQ